MTNTTAYAAADPACRVCSAPQGAFVRRSNLNRAVWVASQRDAPASTFWCAAEQVRLDRSGVCLETTGCNGVPRNVGAA